MKWAVDWLAQVHAAALYPALHAHITEHNDQLQAFSALDTLAHLQRAANAAQTLPLRGLPVGIKDIIDTHRLPTEFGSPIYRGHQARRDAAVVNLLQANGAVIMGKTTSTEFAFLEPAATLNPCIIERTPGGSSAGSAAAVAAGWLAFAVGTQTGGSIIRPAAYCGVVGFKPSAGLLAMTGVNEFSRSLDTLGFFTSNMALMQFFCSPLHPLFATKQAQLNVPRIGFIDEYPWGPADAMTQRNLTKRLSQLRDAGYEVTKVTLPGGTSVAFEAHAIVQNYEVISALAWEWQHHKEQLSPILRNQLHQSQTISFEQYQQAQRQIGEARRDMHKLFERVDLLLLPSAPGVAPDRSTTGSSSFNRLWTALGMPALTLPTWHQGEQLEPLGIQLIAPVLADASLLDWAAQLEPVFAQRAN
jgi:Asp-tRNA(Asn)/Glu-tRNA(Gln) amidotransferase A subunit family amidase